MRRITSVFRRNDKSKNDPPPPPTSKQSGLSSSAHQHPPSLRPGVLPRQPSKKGRFLSSITVSTASPPLPPLDHNHSSASSAGSASFSLQTPDDDGGSHLGAAVLPPPTQQPPRKDSSWFSWKGKPSPQIALSTQSYSPSPPPQWPDSAATVGALPLPARTANAAAVDSDDDDDETSDGESSSSSGAPLNSSSQPLRPDRALAPTEYFVALSLNRLTPSLSQPPLLHVPDAPLFPRSMCSPSALSSTPSLAVSMHRRRVLARLQRRDMSPADRHMMLTFGPRPESKLNACMRPQQPDEGARYDLKRVQPHSRGLRRWTARPYFEERVSVWTPDPTSGAVSASVVKGCGFGVLALDVSEALELLAGHDDPSEEPQQQQQQQQQQPRPQTTFEQELLLPPSAHSSGSVSDRSSWSDKPPSPLRHQSDVSAMTAPISASLSVPVLPSLPPIQSARAPRSISASVLPSSSSTSTVMTASTSSTIMPSASQEPAAVAAPRREVRFTPNVTTESKVPKDYVLRIQRNKEEKARFLREEQQRREHETERLKHEQERQRWEEEKRKWESERRVIEEQRKRKSYADELAAARARRDQRHALPSRASRDSRESYARPQYDLRQGSETSIGGNTGSRPREGSSGSSRQGSSSGYASTPRTPNTSRPPSTYSATSTDESRAREAHASRRASNISVASSYRSQASAMGYGWPSSPTMPMLPPMSPVSPMAMSYAMPLVPMIPQFAAMPMPMDMPLLPPNAPFMMHGNGSRSRTSSSSRQSASSRNASPARAPGSPAHNNRSSERVGSTAPSSRGRAHQRAGSGDMKRGPPPSASATSQRDRAASAGRGTSGSSSTYLNGAAGLGMCPPTLVTQNSWAAPSPPQQQHMSRAAPMPRRSTAFA